MKENSQPLEQRAIDFAFYVLALFSKKDIVGLKLVGDVPFQNIVWGVLEIERYPERIVLPSEEVKSKAFFGRDIDGDFYFDIPFSSELRSITDLELRLSIKDVDGNLKFTFCDVLVA